MLNSLSRNNFLNIQGIRYEIERNRVSAQQVVLLNNDTGVERTVTYSEISSLYARNELKFDSKAMESIQSLKLDATERQFLLLSDETRKLLERKKGYAEAITDQHGRMLKGTANQQAAIYEHAKLNDPLKEELGIPSLSTVRRWTKKLKASFGNILILLRRPPTPSKSNPDVASKRLQEERNRELFHYVIDEYYMKQKSLRATKLPDKMRIAIKTIQRYENCTVPSLSTLYRWIKELPEFEKVAKKKGWLQAKRDFPSGTPVIEPTYLNEAAEIDHTQLDINVVDPETGEVLGRPWLTVILEKMSRMVLGFYLSMDAPCARTVLKAFRHAILSKDYVKEAFGIDIESEYPCMGMPEQVQTDNGRDLHASEVQRVIGHFCDVVYLPKGSPQMKGRVERFFRTLNEGLFHELDGTTFSNYIKCGDYDSKGEAIYTLADINRIVHKWVIDEYHVTVHRSLGISPLNFWKQHVDSMPPIRLPGSITEIDEMLWMREVRYLQKDGISYESLKYRSPQLMDIARQYGMNIELNIFVDPEDLSVIRVVIPNTKSTIDVPCVQAKYTMEQVSLAEHKNILQQANKEKAGARAIAEPVLIRTRQWLENIEAEAKGSKKGLNKKRKKKAAGNSEEFNGTKPKTIGEVSKVEVTSAVVRKTINQLTKLEVQHVNK